MPSTIADVDKLFAAGAESVTLTRCSALARPSPRRRARAYLRLRVDHYAVPSIALFRVSEIRLERIGAHLEHLNV